MDNIDFWTPFLTAEFGIACVATAAVAEIGKRLLRWRRPSWYTSKAGQSGLQAVNILIGPAGVWLAYDAMPFKQVLGLGLCAGLLSHFVYSLIKRVIGEKGGSAGGPRDTQETKAVGGDPPA
jgi:hypothetical protein